MGECVSIVSVASGVSDQVCGVARVSTEFRRHGIPRNFLTSEVISAQFRRNSAKFRGIPRNFAGIEPEITSVFRGMPKCHFRGHPRSGYGSGLEKTRFFYPAQWVFWDFWVFMFFWGVFCPDERVFRVFSVSQILLGASRL